MKTNCSIGDNRRALGAGRVLRLARDVCSARLMGAVRARIAPIGSRLGEVAEHKTSLGLQMFKLKIKCQTKN